MERQKYNKLILDELNRLCDKHPRLRFHQLLFCCDLLHTTTNPDTGISWLDDPFYMESEDAWNKLKESNIRKKLYN